MALKPASLLVDLDGAWGGVGGSGLNEYKDRDVLPSSKPALEDLSAVSQEAALPVFLDLAWWVLPL